MNRTQIHQRAHAVIDALTDLEPGQDQAQGPGWRKAVRNRIRTEHWETLTAALGDDHHQAVAALVAMLRPGATSEADHVTAMQQARSDEWERNRRRLDGQPPDCATCDDTGIRFDIDDNGHECNHQPPPVLDAHHTPTDPSIIRTIRNPSIAPPEAP